MSTLFKSFLIILMSLIALNLVVGCASRSIKTVKPVKPNKIIYTPISTKRLNCIHDFLNRDIEIIKANTVCTEVFEVK